MTGLSAPIMSTAPPLSMPKGLINIVTEIPRLIVIDSRITADRKEGFIEGPVSVAAVPRQPALPLNAAIPVFTGSAMVWRSGRHSNTRWYSSPCGIQPALLPVSYTLPDRERRL